MFLCVCNKTKKIAAAFIPGYSLSKLRLFLLSLQESSLLNFTIIYFTLLMEYFWYPITSPKVSFVRLPHQYSMLAWLGSNFSHKQNLNGVFVIILAASCLGLNFALVLLVAVVCKSLHLEVGLFGSIDCTDYFVGSCKQESIFWQIRTVPGMYSAFKQRYIHVCVFAYSNFI